MNAPKMGRPSSPQPMSGECCLSGAASAHTRFVGSHLGHVTVYG